MHYYKRNLGDYAKKAGRLSMLQHGSYTLLIDACYDREIFPTLEQAIEWTWASSTEEIEAVKFVLSKFFILGYDSVYVQDRILQELVEYHGKAETNKRIAIERETKRKEKSTNRAPDVNEPPPNHKPLTNNQEPITNNKEPPNPQTPSGLSAPTKKTGIALKTFIEACKAKGERPLRDYTSLWTYTKAVGISEEFIALAWAEFCRRFMPGGAQHEKRQKDWRCTFRKYVENNYFKLWAIDQHGAYFLTTLGKQAEKFQEVAA